MPKFLADSFHAHRHLLAIFKGLCIIISSGTAEAMPKFSADLFYVQHRPSTVVSFLLLNTRHTQSLTTEYYTSSLAHKLLYN